MKKLIALCLAACMSLAVLTSCDTPVDPIQSTTENPGIVSPGNKKYEVKDGLLTACIGQADENGVYVVPDEVTAIAESAFAGDTTLKKIVIGSQVTMLGGGVFDGCTSLEEVVIEEGVTEIGSYCFYGCTSLAKITIPKSVTYIHPYAFDGCSALTELSLPGVRQIDTAAFWYCTALERVTFSEDLTNIGAWAFAQNVNLSETNLGELRNLKNIGDYAFAACSMLLSVEIPEGVERVGKLAFYECTRLADVTIGSTVKNVDYAAFNFTPWYQENKADYLVVGDGVLIKCNVYPEEIDLNNQGIKVIGATAFWNALAEGQSAEYGYRYAEQLKKITLPDTLTAIGTSAFYGCYDLTDVVLPAGVTEIGDNAFHVYASDYENKTMVDYSKCENLETIGAYAFYGCGGMTSMALPKTVKKVGAYAFAGTKAYVDFMNASAEKKENDFYITGDGILLAAYIADNQTSVIVPEGVKNIAGSVFAGWDMSQIPEDVSVYPAMTRSKYYLSYTVKELKLPSTLEVIGDSAFYRMLSIEKLTLPASLRVVGADAFAFCTKLASLSGGNSIEEIGSRAFYYCTSIPGFQFSENTKTIGSNVFGGCSALEHVYLPRGLDFPGTEIFNEECLALKTLSLDPSARPRLYTIIGGLPKGVNIYYYHD